jgi:hypothetical protein
VADLRIAKTWSIVLIGPQGTPAAFSRSIQLAVVSVLNTAAISALSLSRFLDRSAAVA